MQDKPYVVIMAGGIGSRFWPYSRNNRPKQFLDILGTGRSLLQMTYDRFREIAEPKQFIVVTNQNYLDIVREQLPELKVSQILTEPLRRNTATCVAYAAYKIHAFDPEAMLIVTPADHLILQEKKFINTISRALQAAQEAGRLITIGIKPNRPETGYGYIQYLEGDNGTPALKVKTFTEKPNSKLAKTFLDSGDFVWNSGMFVWKVTSLLDAFSENMPDVAEVFEDGDSHFGKPTEQEFINRAYSMVKNVSIDYGIMEKSDKVYVILGDFGWSDLGSWHSIHELQEKDENNNVVEANALLYDTKNSYLKMDSEKLVVVEGLDNYLINETDNVLLICKLGGEKKFRDFVANAKKKGEDFV
ncbi:mannose-1-phosphate guanylyltransferase [Algoriphagus boritolerans]|uniref:mannose-1-phosphate guanylyltransferase n=1 Tax=Algoriphagus boritolerans DSM 17298 = JCM 18970 TaxID=1120964 RepID=A0A1H5RZT5_9BACT|nr:mannose-1-phosphate guanylyltransferase [Algoriphagus boritolerans]SEF43031.1 mannose-1-phosphate guanylyltransferase [Algoriphagus boritolerans DSM 17298 = JCM 18970]